MGRSLLRFHRKQGVHRWLWSVTSSEGYEIFLFCSSLAQFLGQLYATIYGLVMIRKANEPRQASYNLPTCKGLIRATYTVYSFLHRFIISCNYAFVFCDYWINICLPTRLYIPWGEGLNRSCCFGASKTESRVEGGPAQFSLVYNLLRSKFLTY